MDTSVDVNYNVAPNNPFTRNKFKCIYFMQVFPHLGYTERLRRRTGNLMKPIFNIENIFLSFNI